MRPAEAKSDPATSGRVNDPAAPARLSLLERGLLLFTELRPGEGPTAVVMFANVFLILSAYYFVKPLRDGWIAVSDIRGLSSFEVKAYSSFAQSLVLIGAVGLYGRLVTRFPRRELITRTTLFCMSNLLVFWLLHRAHTAQVGVVFYIWVGMFGLFVVSQFWAFAADLYSDERGRRLMPVIAIGATAGAVAGSFVSETIVRSRVLDSGALLLVANVPLLASIGLTTIADRRGPIGRGSYPEGKRPATAAPPEEGTHVGAVMLVYRHRYLLAVAGVTLFTHWVSTNGDNLLFRVVQEALAHEVAARPAMNAEATMHFVREGTTAFYGAFFFWVNLCALFLQAFWASRLLKYGGFALILMLLPVIALGGYAAMAFLPYLLVVRVMKTAENSTSYSINNTAQQVLWLPATSEMKYKAKPAIETVVVRFGDGLAAMTVLIGTRVYALSTRSFFLFNVALVIICAVDRHGRRARVSPHQVGSGGVGSALRDAPRCCRANRDVSGNAFRTHPRHRGGRGPCVRVGYRHALPHRLGRGVVDQRGRDLSSSASASIACHWYFSPTPCCWPAPRTP